jgi:hypothetical protein
MGPDAKAAIPVLRNLIKDEPEDFQLLPETLAALYQLAPDGKALAEKWLKKSQCDCVRSVNHIFKAVYGREMMFGAPS